MHLGDTPLALKNGRGGGQKIQMDWPNDAPNFSKFEDNKIRLLRCFNLGQKEINMVPQMCLLSY